MTGLGILVAVDLSITFLILFGTDFHGVGRHWLLSLIFRLLNRYSVTSHPTLDVAYDFNTNEIDCMRLWFQMLRQ